MQSVEQFLQEYFQARTESLRESHRGFKLHAERFFSRSYQPFDLLETIADSEAGRISTVTCSEGSTEVTTTGPTGGNWRFRYRLSSAGDNWIITSMEMECGICHGSRNSKSGQYDCRLCKGAGWNLVGEKRGG